MVVPLATSAPTGLRAVQNNATSVQVSWNQSPGTTGYRITYNDGDSSDSVDVSGGSTDNYLLTGLQNGDSYTISIVATSELFPSESVQVTIGLGIYVALSESRHTTNEDNSIYGFLHIVTLNFDRDISIIYPF